VGKSSGKVFLACRTEEEKTKTSWGPRHEKKNERVGRQGTSRPNKDSEGKKKGEKTSGRVFHLPIEIGTTRGGKSGKTRNCEMDVFHCEKSERNVHVRRARRAFNLGKKEDRCGSSQRGCRFFQTKGSKLFISLLGGKKEQNFGTRNHKGGEKQPWKAASIKSRKKRGLKHADR